MFLVRSVYFNLRNIFSKSGTFLPGHSVHAVYCYGDYLTELSTTKNIRSEADKGTGMMCWLNDSKRDMP